MTEAEALDMAAKAAGWDDWEDLFCWSKGEEVEYVRAHAKTIMENAALKRENERLREAGAFLLARLDDLEWHDGQFEETARQYFGHVDPAIYHFRAALKEIEGD